MALGGNLTVEGNGHSCESGFYGYFGGAPGGMVPVPIFTWRNLTCTNSFFQVRDGARVSCGGLTMASTNTKGPEYLVTMNGVFYHGAGTYPGDQPGVASAGGQVQ